MTIYQVVKAYIETKLNKNLSMVEFNNEIVEFGKKLGKMAFIGSYERELRRFKTNEFEDIELKRIENDGKKYSIYKVVKKVKDNQYELSLL